MQLDPASFAAGRNLPDLQRRFGQTLGPALVRVASRRLTSEEMAQCMKEAALGSGWGRFVLGHNYWMLPGRGDAGAFLLVRVRQDPTTVSGVRPSIEKYAKFSSLPAAIDAWCKRRGK